MRRIVSFLACLLFAATFATRANASTVFTYQGELTNNLMLANGDFDFRFILYSAEVGGSQIGPIVTLPAVPVAQGVFTVPLDFGVVFGSSDSWLDIAVKPAAAPSYTLLSPRQLVTPAPRALALSLPYLDVADVTNVYAIDVTNVGNGGAAHFEGGYGNWDVVYVETDGIGSGMRARVGPNGQGSAVLGYNYGTQRYAGEFEIYNVNSNKTSIYSRTNGSGYALQAEINNNTLGSAIYARTMSNLSGSYAAQFSGPVVVNCQGASCNNTAALRIYGNLNVVGTLSKSAGSFRIDHPLDPTGKVLSHSFVESPDMKNIYDGVATLDASGTARIDLPDWFEALNESFRYQLTAIGSASPGLYVSEEVRDNRFAIAGGTPHARVSWQVTGIRHDAYAKAHPIPVEEEKVGADRGRYLVPDAYGLPADQAIGIPKMPPQEPERLQ